MHWKVKMSTNPKNTAIDAVATAIAAQKERYKS